MTSVFLFDQYAELNFYSASSLKQQTAGGNIFYFILVSNQRVLILLLNATSIAEKQLLPNFIVFGLTRQGM